MTRVGAVQNYFNPQQASQSNQPSAPPSQPPAQGSSPVTAGDPARSKRSSGASGPTPEPRQQPEEKSFWGKLLDYGKGYLNTMMGNHPIGLGLGLFGVRPPFQQEGEKFRKDIAHPVADYAATGGTATGNPWVPLAANLTNAGMYMQDGQYGDAFKSLASAVPEGAAAKAVQAFELPKITNVLTNSLARPA